MSLMGTRPRVLIVTPNILSVAVGGGVTLSRLFEGWPLDRIAQVHSDTSPPNSAVCTNYFSIAGPFVRPHMAPLLRRAASLAGFAVGGGANGLVWTRLPADLAAWARDFGPDLILSQTGSLAFLRLTKKLLDHTGARLVLHASDDWVTDWPSNVVSFRVPGVWSRLNQQAREEFAELVARASARMAISGRMAEVFRQRYGVDWSVFSNCVDPARWSKHDRLLAEHSNARPFGLLYSGSVLANSQRAALFDIAQAVQELVAEGESVSLTIASHDAGPALRRSFRDYRNVLVSSFVSPDELPERLTAADLLVLPVSFEPMAAKFMRLSIPGKTAEYVYSGTPILVYGPLDTAVVQFALADDWAEVVPERSIDRLKAAIRRLSQDTERRRTIAARARYVADRTFNADRLRPKFQRALIEASE